MGRIFAFLAHIDIRWASTHLAQIDFPRAEIDAAMDWAGERLVAAGRLARRARRAR
jgi:hypothetical protein